MSFLDEIRKLARPYGDPDEEQEDFDEDLSKDSFSERRHTSDERRNSKILNIHATTQIKVVVVKPEQFEIAKEIADHLKEKRTVVLNLESTEPAVARRLVDFLSGVTYATEGNIRKIAVNTYLITPYYVNIEGDIMDELENNGIYL